MQPKVMQCLVSLAPGGAERLALTILDRGRDRVRGSVCGLVRGTGALIPEIERLGLAWHVLAEKGQGRFRVWRTLHGLLRRKKIDILHVQAGYLLSFVLPAARLAGAKVIYTEHARHSLEHQPSLARLVRLAVPFVSAVTCVTQNLKDFMSERLGIPAKSIRVISNGVDIDRFRPQVSGGTRDVAGLPLDWRSPGITVFGNVARFTEAKDHPGLLRAFAALCRTRSEARLLLVGDGETRPEVERLVGDLGLADRVHLAGMRQDVPELLRSMDVFVLSSKREGMPISVLEAMACGLPVVTTDVGGIREVVEDGRHAKIIQAESVEALAQAMLWMMENLEQRAGMARTGVELVRGKYGHDRMVARYVELYEQAWGRA